MTDSYLMIYPKRRYVSRKEILGIYYDALADSVCNRVDDDDIEAVIAELQDIGYITIGKSY